MAAENTTLPFHPPKVLSMDVDPSNQVESEYRVLIGNEIKYISIDPGTLDGDTLSFPPSLFDHLPELPSGDWTRAHIFLRSSHITVELSSAPLKGATTRWHRNSVDIQSLTIEEQLGARVQVVKYNSKSVIAKIARFEFEIPRIEAETTVYQLIDGHGIGPAFLGHLIERNRVMGFLVERIDGRHGGIRDMKPCQAIVERLHSLKIVHGDLNRYNFIVSSSGVTLVDFENATKNESKEAMEKEFAQLSEQLTEETDRGRKCIPEAEWSDSE